MRILFDEFKAIARAAVTSPAFVASNLILQDATTLQSLLDRIDALSPEYLLTQEHDDVMTDGGIVGTNFTIDHLHREIDIADGALSAPNGDRVIFNQLPTSGTGAFPFLPPLELYGWQLSPDSTAADTDVEVHWRRDEDDEWHQLEQVDRVVLPAGFQLSLFLPAQLDAPVTVKKLLVYGRQI